MNYVKEDNENVLNLIANRQQQKAAVERKFRCKVNSNGRKKEVLGGECRTCVVKRSNT